MTVPAVPQGKSVEVFFDAECPLCMREIRLLQRLDQRRGRIAFTDIARPGFDATVYGKSQAEFMGSIQGRDAQGGWIEGVEVFRQLYGAVGLGWLVGVTRVWGIRHCLDAMYGVFARNRLQLTGRSDARCTTDRCSIGSAEPLRETP